MKIRIRLVVSLLIFAIASVYVGSRTEAQTLSEPLPHMDYTLLDQRTNMVRGAAVLEGRGPATIRFFEAELATNRAFLKLSNTGAPPVTIEIIRACEVVLNPSNTNGWFRISISTAAAPTISGGLKIEVVMDGRRCFNLTADELTVVRRKAP